MSENQIFNNLLRQITNKYNLIIWNSKQDDNLEAHLRVLNYITERKISLKEKSQIIFYKNFNKEKVLLIADDFSEVGGKIKELKKMHPSMDALIFNWDDSLENISKELSSFSRIV